jgi:transcriptional regulator with XRE-family HTH domain
MGKLYGSLLREERERNGFGLREFAELIGVKPSNLSDIETNKKAPYFTAEQHEEILCHLGVPKNSKRWYAFFDSARIRGSLPKDILKSSIRVEKAVISLLRTVDRKQLTDVEIHKLEEYINRELGGFASHDA